jgi:hypothetical protein
MDLLGILLLFAEVDPPNLVDQFHYEFRNQQPGATIDWQLFTPVGRDFDKYATFERDGLVISLPGGKGPVPTAGIATKMKVEGDFKITASCEVLNAGKPDAGYGCGAALYVMMDSKMNEAVSFARNVTKTGAVVFVTDRIQQVGGGPSQHRANSFPTAAKFFKLRLTRTGSTLEYSVAEEGSAEFRKLDEAEIGTGDVRWIQLSADAGGSQSPVAVRFKDLTIRAEHLPSGTRVLPEMAPRKVWWLAGLASGVIVAACLGSWWFFRAKRSPPAASRRPTAD